TRPAPARRAPCDVISAAPMNPLEPATTPIRPNWFLYALNSRLGTKPTRVGGLAIISFGFVFGGPNSLNGPHAGVPTQINAPSPPRPSFAYPIVNVKSATTQSRSALPESLSRPVGRSTANTYARFVFRN